MKNVIDHFRKSDPRMYALSRKIPLQPLARSGDYFVSLVEDIVSQQLSDTAARSIFGKVAQLFPGSAITPASVLAMPDQALRDAGLSWSKVKYVKELARGIAAGDLKLAELDAMDNDGVMAALTKIKGIGAWTGEMFLMFSLGREDVFSHGDLGLRKAIRRVYHKKSEPSRQWVEKVSRAWSPYRTYACLLLWRSLDLSDRELG